MIATRIQKHAAFRSLSEVDLARLRGYAQARLKKIRYSLSIPDLDAEDVVHDAIIRILDSDGRAWPMDRVDFVSFLIGVIKSMTSNEVKTQVKHRPLRVKGEEASTELEHAPTATLPPDLQLQQHQEARRRDWLYDKFEEMLDHDPLADELYRLKCQRIDGPEIQRKLNITETEYMRRYQRLRRIYRKVAWQASQGE